MYLCSYAQMYLHTLGAQVGFTYPGAPKPTLSDVSIYITLSSRVAVLGANGAGKSTMIKILTGAQPGQCLRYGTPQGASNAFAVLKSVYWIHVNMCARACTHVTLSHAQWMTVRMRILLDTRTHARARIHTPLPPPHIIHRRDGALRGHSVEAPQPAHCLRGPARLPPH